MTVVYSIIKVLCGPVGFMYIRVTRWRWRSQLRIGWRWSSWQAKLVIWWR